MRGSEYVLTDAVFYICFYVRLFLEKCVCVCVCVFNDHLDK